MDTPEQLARKQIHTQLIACGWLVQNYKSVQFSAGRGIALREAPLKSGTCDCSSIAKPSALSRLRRLAGWADNIARKTSQRCRRTIRGIRVPTICRPIPGASSARCTTSSTTRSKREPVSAVDFCRSCVSCDCPSCTLNQSNRSWRSSYKIRDSLHIHGKISNPLQ
jgi:hypothetical protein